MGWVGRALLVTLAGCTSFAASSSPADPADTGPDAGADAQSPSDAKPLSRYAAAVLADAPVAYLRLGEPEGATSASSETGSIVGTLIGEGITFGVPGLVAGDTDTAASFSGSGRISLGNELDFPGTLPFSYEAWVQVDRSDPRQYRMIFNKEVKDGAQQTELANVFVEGSSIGFERYVDAAQRVVRTTAITIGAKHHMVGTYDGTTLRVYLDGEERRQTSDTRAAKPKPVPLLIGGEQAGGFVGVIDEVAIYDKALAPERVRAHFDAGK